MNLTDNLHAVHEFLIDVKDAPVVEKSTFGMTQTAAIITATVGMSVNELAVIVGMVIGFAGLVIQYLSYRARRKHEDKLASIRMAEAIAKGADVSGIGD